jgi:hypothetical protein
MPQADIICLANSRKHGGRCIAGLRVDGGGWLRPVGTLPDGTLYPPDYTLSNGSEAAVLDLIQVGIQAHRPSQHQPENWVIDGNPWTLKFRPIRSNLSPIFQSAIAHGPELIHGFSDRIACASFQQTPLTTSLALIAPATLDLYHQLSYSGRPQARGRFFLGQGSSATLYDLAITDPIWEPVVVQQGFRILRQTESKFLLTISLGEPFGLNCYKLIAAIILLPSNIVTVF